MKPKHQENRGQPICKAVPQHVHFSLANGLVVIYADVGFIGGQKK